MTTNQSSSSGGVGFFSLLALLFIALKLTGHIDWSWWWVLAPLWGPVAVVLIIIGIVYVYLFIKEWIDLKHRQAARKRLLQDKSLDIPLGRVWPERNKTKTATCKKE